MTPDQLTPWAVHYPWPAGVVALITLGLATALAAAVVRAVRRVTLPGPVLFAGAAAALCTAYSGDTSWRFAAHRLGITDADERIILFAAAELASLACAVMARANKAAAGRPGVPGALIWCIASVQVLPCYATSGVVGGTVRAAFGPVLAGLLWHLAMGLEIRLVRPGALSTGLPAVIARELRERLLSRLGLAVRDRDAAQITRDRAVATAVRLASRRHRGPWARHRLAAAVIRSGATRDGQQQHTLMRDLAGRRTALELATVPVASPWVPAVPEQPHPPTPLGVTGAELRRLDPLDAVRTVAAARRGATPAEVASIATEYGVPISETMARIAMGAGNPERVPEVAAAPEVTTADETEVTTEPAVEPEEELVTPESCFDVFVPDTWPSLDAADPLDVTAGTTTVYAAQPGRRVVTEVVTLTPAELRKQARKLNREAVDSTGRPVTVGQLRTDLGLSRRDAAELRRYVVEGSRS